MFSVWFLMQILILLYPYCVVQLQSILNQTILFMWVIIFKAHTHNILFLYFLVVYLSQCQFFESTGFNTHKSHRQSLAFRALAIVILSPRTSEHPHLIWAKTELYLAHTMCSRLMQVPMLLALIQLLQPFSTVMMVVTLLIEMDLPVRTLMRSRSYSLS